MNNNEYELKLKAVLDDSDVKKKLAQLRGQQMSGNTNTPNASGLNIQNALGQLNATLQRLNTILTKLDKSVVSGRGGSSAGTDGLLAGSVAARVGGRTRRTSGQIGSPADRLLDSLQGTRRGRALASAYRQGNFSATWLRNQIESRHLMNETNAMMLSDMDLHRGGMNPAQMNMQMANWRRSQRLSMLTGQAGGQTAVGHTPIGMSPGGKAMGRLIGGMVIGQLAGGVSNYAESTGNTGVAKTISAAGNVAQGAFTGAAIGSIIPGVGTGIGAGIGATIALVNSGLEELAERAREAAEAMGGQEARVKSGRLFDIQMRDFKTQQEDKKRLEKKDWGYFRQQLDETGKKFRNVQENMGKMGIEQEGGVEAYEKKTLELMRLRGADDAEVKQRKRNVDIYRDQTYWYQKHSGRIDYLNQILKNQEKDNKTGSAMRGGWHVPSPQQRASAAQDAAQFLQKQLEGMVAPNMNQVNSLASQGFMISQSDDSIRLKQQTDYLRDIYTVTKQIRDKETEAATYA